MLKKLLLLCFMWVLVMHSLQAQFSLIHNPDRMLLTHTIQDWDTTSNSWINRTEKRHAHTSDTLVSNRYYLYWITDSAAWQVVDETQYGYDSLKRIISGICVVNSDTIGNPKERFFSYFNNLDSLDSVIYQKYDTLQHAWQNNRRYRHHYNNNLMDTFFQDWVDNITYEWKQLWRWPYTYDTLGRVTSYTSMYYKSDSNQWINSIQVAYLYNSNDELGTKVEKGWSTIQHLWQDQFIHFYTYNQNQQLKQDSLIQMFWGDTSNTSISFYEYYSSGKLYSITSYMWRNEKWSSSDRELFTYIDESIPNNVGVDHTSQLYMKLFPNPSTNSFNIQLNRIIPTNAVFYLYNSEGLLTKHIPLNEPFTTITCDDMPRGIYPWQLVLNGHISESGILIFK